LIAEPTLYPLVSFLIPAYNHAAFVGRCLDSVLEDGYPNKEIVIIDDGSRDETRAVVEAWVARHGSEVGVQFRSRPNKGVSATLNELMSLARGEFVRLGASDDYYLPDGTRKLAEYLVAHPDKAAVVGDSIVVDESGAILHGSAMVDLHGADKRDYGSDAGIAKAVISNWALAGPVPLVRKSAITAGGGWDENLRIDDWDFFLRIAARNGLGFVDALVCAYRIHGTNTCRVVDVTTRIRNQEESRRVAQVHLDRFQGPNRLLLSAECRLKDAKIAYLRRQPFALARHLLAFARLRALAFMGERSASRGSMG
jgi:glycosyltransferase involved in cell wall biosynthesis